MFGTDNIVFVPEEEKLRIWDIQGWRRITIDLHALHPFVRLPGMERITNEIAEWTKKAAQFEDDSDRGEAEQTAGNALLSLRDHLDGKALGSLPDGASGLAFWVRWSDRAPESFDPEDYLPAPLSDSNALRIPVFGSLSLVELGDFDISLPGEGNDAPFGLSIPPSGLVIDAIPVDEPLPLADEYCGALGVSARGNSVNLALDTSVAAAHVGCTPMAVVAGGLLTTMYFGLTTETKATVTKQISRKQLAAVRARLSETGFGVAASSGSWEVYRRGDSVIHLYNGLPGKESAGVLQLPPFAVAAMADGSHDPGARAELLAKSIVI